MIVMVVRMMHTHEQVRHGGTYQSEVEYNVLQST